jgi:hypothetical protein
MSDVKVDSLATGDCWGQEYLPFINRAQLVDSNVVEPLDQAIGTPPADKDGMSHAACDLHNGC